MPASCAHSRSLGVSRRTIATESELSESGELSVATPKRWPPTVLTWSKRTTESVIGKENRSADVAVAFNELARDDHAHDFVGAFEYLMRGGIAH